ncbi:MAG TPA: glycosyltransferase family 1 protein [Haliscomenobacter sp.]|uniref:glycosyltransferase family 4 protein n=1 Tax=Haliscomenobacter sp. TaxID=2717303 RepID=UPI002C9402E4|nr:glycosyltransferase family 1 protein [Haliscomenobacter sp.]HOY20406.1 glycosyltransferase family 1 protein [Haliscomenobacter sp.]HPH19866.1 glycosyltransferase family 1 protein [Haliscomenobacter sp.]
MLRFGYDAKRLFNNFTGLGNYSRTLLKNLAYYYPDHAYFLFSPKVERKPETKLFTSSASFSLYSPSRYQRPVWRSYGIRYALKRQKIQLFHGLSNELPIGIRSMGIKSVVTIHDLVFKHRPDYYPLIDRAVYDIKFKYACRQADAVVAISESTKNDIVNFYGIRPEKIKVIYQSCDERFMQEKSPKLIDQILAKYQLPAEFMLYVGTISERKNLLGVVQAMSQLPASLKIPLVVIGQGKEYKAQVQHFLQKEGLSQLVIFTQVDNDDLPAIFQKARIFLYPSRLEGFGIPVIEALFSRTPVISSKVSSLPEAAGPASWLVDPEEPLQITAGIERILSDDAYRKNMIDAGFQYAQSFRGEVVTEEMMDLYEQVLGRE